MAEAYLDASGLQTLYGLLVIKNGHLIAEGYFNEGGVNFEQLSGRQSATKGFVSALVGVALDQGCLTSVDQEGAGVLPGACRTDRRPRKEQITVRHLLRMRAGYPDDDYGRQYLDSLFFADNWHWTPHLVGFPLLNDPGTEFAYSSLSSHLLAIIVARTCDTDLHSLAQENLFTPIGAEVGDWTRDADNYNWGWGEIYVTGRDMAKFGSLYLNGGEFAGNQGALVRLGQRIADPLLRRHQAFRGTRPVKQALLLGYGYQWWSATAGEHRFDYAAGHGGNLIVLLHDLDMIIVTTADPLYELPSEEGAPFEGPIIDMVGKFIRVVADRLTDMEPDGITHFDCPEAFRVWLKRYHSERDELWRWVSGRNRRGAPALRGLSPSTKRSASDGSTALESVWITKPTRSGSRPVGPVARGACATSIDTKRSKRKVESSRLASRHTVSGRKRTRESTPSNRRPRPGSLTTTSPGLSQTLLLGPTGGRIVLPDIDGGSPTG